MNNPSDTTTTLENRLANRLNEAFDELWGSFVDRHEALADEDGRLWLTVGNLGLPGSGGTANRLGSPQLAEIRDCCRSLATTNEYALNGHENRISYIVGAGHSYRVVAHGSAPADPHMVAAAQELLNEFLLENQWRQRQQELVLRVDRDGEAFVRLFTNQQGVSRVRFVEPDQVYTPVHLTHEAAASCGIHTASHDVESVLGYYVDGEWVEADEIQHRKTNVDANVKRGLPLFYPVLKNLRRAEKLLRNMSLVAEIQSAIAIIRRHRTAPASSVQQFVSQTADAHYFNPQSSRTQHLKRYAPGTILDASADVEYDFPANGLDAGNFVMVLEAELRAIASRLVMPEFMLTSNAANSNYSSTMVAEGPAVRMFERLQAQQIEWDTALLRRVLQRAESHGALAAGSLRSLAIQAVGPSLVVRDKLSEAQAWEIAHHAGILSRQTWSQRLGLDFDREQQQLAAENNSAQNA